MKDITEEQIGAYAKNKTPLSNALLAKPTKRNENQHSILEEEDNDIEEKETIKRSIPKTERTMPIEIARQCDVDVMCKDALDKLIEHHVNEN